MISLLDVLKASKGLPVSDLYAAMWGRKMVVKYTVTELEGTLPMSIVSAGEPLIDYRIYGNTEQTGTPTPENPIMPIGCGVRTENLWDFTTQPLSGTGYLYYGNINLPAGTYTLRADLINNNANMSFAVVNSQGNTVINTIIFNHNSRTFTSDYNMTQLRLYVNGTADRLYLTLTKGSTAPASYIPPGYKLPILSNSTVTNIYLGEVPTTRRIKKLVLTGEEAWSRSALGHAVQVYTPQIIECMPLSPAICTHFNYNRAEVTYPNIGEFVINSAKVIIFGVDENTFVDVDAWKAYLAAQYANGTPVTIWYVLAEPETGIVNEALMKIGDYADTVSKEQAGVSIPTAAGSTVIDYDGALKPSQMYIKYLEVKK